MPALEFVHDYTAQDHTEVMRSAVRKWWRSNRARYLWLIFLAVLGFAILWRLDASDLLVGLYSGALVGWIWTLRSYWHKQKMRWAKAWEENPSFRDQLRTQLTPEGLRRFGTNTEFYCKWDAITSLVETANLFVLYTGTSWFVTIPKRVCETSERLEELKTFLSSKVSEKA